MFVRYGFGVLVGWVWLCFVGVVWGGWVGGVLCCVGLGVGGWWGVGGRWLCGQWGERGNRTERGYKLRVSNAEGCGICGANDHTKTMCRLIDREIVCWGCGRRGHVQSKGWRVMAARVREKGRLEGSRGGTCGRE